MWQFKCTSRNTVLLLRPQRDGEKRLAASKSVQKRQSGQEEEKWAHSTVALVEEGMRVRMVVVLS